MASAAEKPAICDDDFSELQDGTSTCGCWISSAWLRGTSEGCTQRIAAAALAALAAAGAAATAAKGQRGASSVTISCTAVSAWLQYAAWGAAARGADPAKARAEDFYTDQWAQNIFRNYLATLTSRVNSFTGVAYRRASMNESLVSPLRM